MCWCFLVGAVQALSRNARTEHTPHLWDIWRLINKLVNLTTIAFWQVIDYTTDRSEGQGNGTGLLRTGKRKQNQWQHAMYVAQLHELAAEQQWENIGGHTVEPLLYDHPQNHIGVVV